MFPELGFYFDTVINYDFTNQKLRYFGSTTFFNDSPTQHFEGLYNYNEVRIERMHGVMLSIVLLTLIATLYNLCPVNAMVEISIEVYV